jgi:hypothetical protein
MKTIEISGTVNTKSESKFQEVKNTNVGIEIDGEGGYVNLSSNDDRYAQVRVGDRVRVLVLDEAPKAKALTLGQPSGKMTASQLEEILREVQREVEKSGFKSSETLKKDESSQGWEDKKIEKFADPQPVICGVRGLGLSGPFSPGTK